LIRESEDLPSRTFTFTLADIGLPFGRIENGIPETSEPVSGIFVLREEPLINGLKIATTSKIVIPRSASERESRLFPGNIGSPIKAFGDDEKNPVNNRIKRPLIIRIPGNDSQ
jgi:hypothetical protein